jgi:cytochrome c-type biogenesis protein CcmH
MFWIICALLLTVAITFTVLPLLRGKAKNAPVLRDAANLEIFRDQIAEMDTDLHNGLLTQELYEQGKRELQARMLEEVITTEVQPNVLGTNPHRVIAGILAVIIPVSAIGLYLKLGSQEAFLPQQSAQSSGAGMGAAMSESSLKALEDKMAQNPQDTDNLRVLARSYAEQQRYVESAQTYNKLTKQVTKDAQLWADFADSLAMASGQNLTGHPTMLINTALSLDPNNPKALALAGAAAAGRAEYPAAIKYWEHLLKLIPTDSEDARLVANDIQQARAAIEQAKGGKMPALQSPVSGGENTAATSGQEGISGTVTLSPTIKANASPDDTLFVLARAAEGPPMPLAVIRKQVKDLPLQFTLDDSLSMSPQMKLSKFDKVIVVARISKSGQPMPQPGDLQGMSAALKPGIKGLKLTIDNLVK